MKIFINPLKVALDHQAQLCEKILMKSAPRKHSENARGFKKSGAPMNKNSTSKRMKDVDVLGYAGVNPESDNEYMNSG